MTEKIAVIGAVSTFAKAQIQDLLKNTDCSIRACDFCSAPSWFTELNTNRLSWLELDITQESFLLAVGDATTVIYLPHQSLYTQELASLHCLETIMLVSQYLSRACRLSNVHKILYLSTMMSQDEFKRSVNYKKMEIEFLLKNSNLPVITIKPALLISSNTIPFKYVLKLIDKLPILIFPLWIEKQVQPVYWKDVVEIITQLHLDKAYTKITRNINIPGPSLLSYRKLMELIFKKKKVQRFLAISNLIPEIVLRMVTGLVLKKSYYKISNWFKSWNQDAVALLSDWKQKRSWVALEDAVKLILEEEVFPEVSYQKEIPIIQRVNGFSQISAKELSLEYFYWLQHFFHNLIRVEIKDQNIKIYFPQKLILLLELEIQSEDVDTIAFNILSGFLYRKKSAGILRFVVSKIKNQQLGFIILENFNSPFWQPMAGLQRWMIRRLNSQFQYYIDEN